MCSEEHKKVVHDIKLEMGVNNCNNSSPSATTTALPQLYNGTVYASHLAAVTAAFLQSIGMPFSYRAHRLVLPRTLQPELAGDFWLPQCNTFLCVYPHMPIVSQCRTHEDVAKLGHNVVVLVGSVASPVRIQASDAKDGWRGWRLEAFTAALTPGWAAWVQAPGDADNIRLGVVQCPYDTQCCTPRLCELFAAATATVNASSTDDDTEEDASVPISE